MLLLPILLNFFAVATGIRAIGEGRKWDFTVGDIFKGDQLAKVYIWLIGSTSFSLIHMIALLTQSPNFVGTELHNPVWIIMHCLIGIFFSTAHLFIDAVFEDEWLTQKFFGTPS